LISLGIPSPDSNLLTTCFHCSRFFETASLSFDAIFARDSLAKPTISSVLVDSDLAIAPLTPVEFGDGLGSSGSDRPFLFLYS
jgi:hypothetical protein